MHADARRTYLALPRLLLLALAACAAPGERRLHAPELPRRHEPRIEALDAEHYALYIALDPVARRIDASLRVRLLATEDGIDRAVLDLVGLVVDRVRDGADRELAWERVGGELRVLLAEPLAEGEAVELIVDYGGAPRSGLWFVGRTDEPADHVFTQGECIESRAWFPCLDHPADRATSELRVELPHGWTSVAAGERIDVGPLPNGGTFEHWRIDVPHPTYLTTLVAGDFAIETETWRGVPLWYVAPEQYAEWMPASFGETPEILDFMNELTGLDYPFSKYSQACVEDFPFGGMENITATTLTCETLTDARGHRDRTSTGLVVHEAAHQWFGNLLTCRDWSHIWLNEGFATYCTQLWFEAVEGRDALRLRMRDAQDHYTRQDVGENRRPMVHDVYRDPMDLFFGGHAYQGGAARLHLLRGVLGDEAFFDGVRRYVAENLGRGVVTADLRRALEAASGEDLTQLFDQWLHSAGYPSFRFVSNWDEGELTVEIEQVQVGGGRTPHVFELPVEVGIRTGDATRVVRIDVDERREVVRLECPQEPRWVRIDPNGWIPKALEVTRPIATWTDLAEHCDDSVARRDALGVLGEALLDEEDQATRTRLLRLLADRLASDPTAEVRAAAAKALAAGTGPVQRGALLAAARTDQDADVRVAALRALKPRGADDQLARFAAEVFQVGYSWKVMAAAAELRVSAAPEVAFDWVHARSEIPSPHGVLEADLIDLLGRLDDRRRYDVLMGRASDTSRHPNVRQAAVRALGRLGSRTPELRTLLLELLDETNLGLRRQAIAAIGELNELAAYGKLREVYRLSPDARERRLIEEVAASLVE